MTRRAIVRLTRPLRMELGLLWPGKRIHRNIVQRELGPLGIVPVVILAPYDLLVPTFPIRSKTYQGARIRYDKAQAADEG